MSSADAVGDSELVVADSHAILWYVKGSPRLSPAGTAALAGAEATDGIVVSVATLVALRH